MSAVEGSKGASRPLAQPPLADGEHVVGVPAKLRRARALDTSHSRKTDPHAAQAVAVVAMRTPTLRPLRYDEELEGLRMVVDRRDELVRSIRELKAKGPVVEPVCRFCRNAPPGRRAHP